jgi:hypothetical protein
MKRSVSGVLPKQMEIAMSDREIRPSTDARHESTPALKAWIAPGYQVLDIAATETSANVCVRNDGVSFSAC